MGNFFEEAGKLGRDVGKFGRSWGGAGRGLGSTAKGIEKGIGEWGGLFGSQFGAPGGYARGEGRMYKDFSYRDRAEFGSLRDNDRMESYRGQSRRNQRRLAKQAAYEEEMAFGEMYADDIARENPRLAHAAAEQLREDPRIQAFLEENGRSANREGSWSERNFGTGTRGATDAEVLMAYERLRETEVGQPFSKRYLTQELSQIARNAQVSQSTSQAPVVTYAPQAAPSAPAAAPSSWSNVTLPPSVTGGQHVTAASAPPSVPRTDEWREFDQRNSQSP